MREQVEVRVLQIDVERKRIGLSMKKVWSRTRNPRPVELSRDVVNAALEGPLGH